MYATVLTVVFVVPTVHIGVFQSDRPTRYSAKFKTPWAFSCFCSKPKLPSDSALQCLGRSSESARPLGFPDSSLVLSPVPLMASLSSGMGASDEDSSSSCGSALRWHLRFSEVKAAGFRRFVALPNDVGGDAIGFHDRQFLKQTRKSGWLDTHLTTNHFSFLQALTFHSHHLIRVFMTKDINSVVRH